MRVAAILITVVVTLVAVALTARAVGQILRVVRLGQPAVGRTDDAATRWRTMLRETLGHTKMLQRGIVGAAHWFVFVGFGLLFATVVTAYGQIFARPDWGLPIIGHWWPFELIVEFFAVATTVGILVLIGIRLANHPKRLGRDSRFSGSTFWQAYYVEYTVLVVGLCIVALRALESALSGAGWNLHHLLSYPLGTAFASLSDTTLANAIWLVATIKLVVSMAWLITISLNTTMGVAWHRFTAFPNIWFRREADGSNALGPLQPMYSGGKPIDFEDPGDDDIFGAGQVEHFTWKGLLDFSTCTECGRCQSVCPAWMTDKPLSPKLLIMNLRDHAYAKAPNLLATDDEKANLPDSVTAEAARPIVGTPDELGVIDPDVLWACTTCGACVQECPVDIEHVDHVMDLRRHQTLIESSFPSELNQLYKGLDNKGNPWNVDPSGRMDWAKDLPFEVKVVGSDVDDLSEVEYLFWVGCAGAFEDRAKKTTRAVAELLHTAGVSFAVLGEAESCTGDPARRAGNEFTYQMLAQQSTETLREAKATKVVATCAHCFNTIGNEYRQLGLELEVVHHTQLLNRLVREGRLTPTPPPADETKPITYHDPCYLGRHNQVYSPPRELLGSLGELEYREMPRSKERSFCCGAGGARMWMEESIGTRINGARTDEAIATGAERIATGCPFCKVMLSDGLTDRQASGAADEQVEVVDVAQLLLDSVRRGAPAEPDGSSGQSRPSASSG